MEQAVSKISKRLLINANMSTKPYLRVEQMCVHYCSFNIVQVGIVFKGSLQQTCLFTELSNMRTVIVCEHLVPQDRICYLV